LDRNELERLMDLLRRAEAPVRVLRHLAWPASVRDRFFADGECELPRVSYPAFNPEATCECTARVRRAVAGREDPVARWLSRQCRTIESGARMLAAAGTAEFLEHSRALYGAPAERLPDETTTPLAGARHFAEVIDSMAGIDLGAPPAVCHFADDLAARMRQAVEPLFGEAAPNVVIVEELSANALAGPQNIRLRRNACFSDRDADQLIQHEAFVHVLTSLNGRSQPVLPMLAASEPGTTRTQEGLAVFAEIITGSMDLDRLRRLVDRVLAIQMAIEGADFLDVYRYFLERGHGREQAFENSRRVFRGGCLSGGVPFTKDGVYIDGLLRVHNFMRTVVALGRADLLRLLFVGKLDLEDLSALAELSACGLCHPPRFLPPWAADLRFLLSYLAYSTFLNGVDMSRLCEHYADLARAAPPVTGDTGKASP